ncbi:MAG: hypothetical protein COS25_01250 [Candidatus Nealsonbacteria bacterium CG02_land_8_20_14_3_00_37_10]|uniref:DUF6938 domain-containing protein n=1 Tax=Candidatus Nealsonbacteria bacterium CG02_land_8_20_14_3_00_37_10 TaxID=1974699 RepID=A0A2M7D9R6_9BACT|nr:MAG: hypothetical protein COS25_01250 [Candidatus Nealsonbacteria bacterium CG02_land_8_20_14_3_00_37_10]
MNKKAWVISVNMGYGHQRTAYPLKSLATEGKIINANDYPGIPKKDRETWETARRFYEFISKFKRVPLVGEFGFFIFDQFQRIISFYPKRDLSKPNFQLKQIFSLIKRGWGRDLIAKCKMQNAKLPFISTFFTPAFMAEYFNYPGEIFCIVCDADISRTWAPFNPKASRIKYFAPNDRVVERLKLYGIREDNIFLTGYPLPQDLVGSENLEILKENLRYRLLNLDPQKRFFQHYEPLVEKHLGELSQESNHPLTLMFAVGGAGAQKEIGIKVAKKLAQKTKNKKIKIVLVAGIKEKTKEYFQKNTRGLDVEIIFEKDIENYFQKFNQALRQTDILWTKPSELSFYSALGMPIIIAPAIGSQEEFNKRWLLKSGFGDSQGNPSNTDQWLFDWLEKGYFAEHAMQGFIEGEKLGTLKIKEIIEKCSG